MESKGKVNMMALQMKEQRAAEHDLRRHARTRLRSKWTQSQHVLDDARADVLKRLEALERAVEALNDDPPVLGNNSEIWSKETPPFSPGDYRDIDRIVGRFGQQANDSDADPVALREDVSKLKDLTICLGRWLMDRLTSTADALAKALGVALAAKLVGLYEAMVEVCQAVANWIGLL